MGQPAEQGPSNNDATCCGAVALEEEEEEGHIDACLGSPDGGAARPATRRGWGWDGMVGFFFSLIKRKTASQRRRVFWGDLVEVVLRSARRLISGHARTTTTLVCYFRIFHAV